MKTKQPKRRKYRKFPKKPPKLPKFIQEFCEKIILEKVKGQIYYLFTKKEKW